MIDSTVNQPLPPGSTLGVLGGGQLGRMFSQSASAMGYRVCVLDPAAESPAAEVSALHIQADYDDQTALAELARTCDAVTTEFENVPADSLRLLQQSVPVSPPPSAVEIAQNRNREKSFFIDHGLPVNHCESIAQLEDIVPAMQKMNGRAILKTASFGYDGKGQQVCHSAAEVEHAFKEFGNQECILEDFVPFDCEISVVLARDVMGGIEVFPVAENQHKNSILSKSIVPARIPDQVIQQATTAAVTLATALNYVGVLAVEMFVCNGAISLNEMAPRPHNSGHYTMDACNVSQFDQQVRVLAGLPVNEVVQYRPAVMVNLLGDEILKNDFSWQQLQNLKNSHVHVYGKKEARAGRKMAHVNVLGVNIEDALAGSVSIAG